MSIKGELTWFAETFGPAIESKTDGGPFDVRLLSAIAYKETGYLWQRAKAAGYDTARILEICVGDTKARKSFPVDRADLEKIADGPAIFAAARKALGRVAQLSQSYAEAYEKPDAFCRGFGIFQYDIQFAEKDPSFFRDEEYTTIDPCIDRCLKELNSKSKRVGLAGKATLTFDEKVKLAIAYNKGFYNSELGLKQGNLNKGSGLYYGEHFAEILEVAELL